jgi:hypothetical protein
VIKPNPKVLVAYQMHLFLLSLCALLWTLMWPTLMLWITHLSMVNLTQNCKNLSKRWWCKLWGYWCHYWPF